MDGSTSVPSGGMRGLRNMSSMTLSAAPVATAIMAKMSPRFCGTKLRMRLQAPVSPAAARQSPVRVPRQAGLPTQVCMCRHGNQSMWAAKARVGRCMGGSMAGTAHAACLEGARQGGLVEHEADQVACAHGARQDQLAAVEEDHGAHQVGQERGQHHVQAVQAGLAPLRSTPPQLAASRMQVQCGQQVTDLHAFWPASDTAQFPCLQGAP